MAKRLVKRGATVTGPLLVVKRFFPRTAGLDPSSTPTTLRALMRFQTLYEGRLIFAILFLVILLGWWRGWGLLVLVGALCVLFCINFFRDPERPVPPGEEVVVAAADGTVADIVEIDEDEVLKTKCRRIGIFLSVLDVHVNKAPIAGEIIYTKHYPGTYPGPYLDARHADCSKFNEALTWAFKGARATLVVRQITGAIARRIVPWSKTGDTVEKGHRFGMIRFGSRTEVYLPLDAEVAVKVGDKVRGAETIIARLK
jgi:phosphatidylserine decarboxylase